ncbi:MAG: hypothetical protein ACRC92_27535 [Peptostreptococcaceae bacterium]
MSEKLSKMKSLVMGQKIEKFGQWEIHNDEEVLGTYWAESNWEAISMYKNELSWAGLPNETGIKASFKESD